MCLDALWSVTHLAPGGNVGKIGDDGVGWGVGWSGGMGVRFGVALPSGFSHTSALLRTVSIRVFSCMGHLWS